MKKIYLASPKMVGNERKYVEEAFDMKFDMKDVLSMKNVGEMVDILQRAAE